MGSPQEIQVLEAGEYETVEARRKGPINDAITKSFEDLMERLQLQDRRLSFIGESIFRSDASLYGTLNDNLEEEFPIVAEEREGVGCQDSLIAVGDLIRPLCCIEESDIHLIGLIDHALQRKELAHFDKMKGNYALKVLEKPTEPKSRKIRRRKDRPNVKPSVRWRLYSIRRFHSTNKATPHKSSSSDNLKVETPKIRPLNSLCNSCSNKLHTRCQMLFEQQSTIAASCTSVYFTGLFSGATAVLRKCRPVLSGQQTFSHFVDHIIRQVTMRVASKARFPVVSFLLFHDRRIYLMTDSPSMCSLLLQIFSTGGPCIVLYIDVELYIMRIMFVDGTCNASSFRSISEIPQMMMMMCKTYMLPWWRSGHTCCTQEKCFQLRNVECSPEEKNESRLQHYESSIFLVMGKDAPNLSTAERFNGKFQGASINVKEEPEAFMTEYCKPDYDGVLVMEKDDHTEHHRSDHHDILIADQQARESQTKGCINLSSILMMQATIRGFLARQYYRAKVLDQQKRVCMVTKIQACWKSWKLRRLYLVNYTRIIILQACIRGFLVRRKHVALMIQARQKKHICLITRVQAYWRGWSVRQSNILSILWSERKAKERSITKIQAHWRGFRTRKRFLTAVKNSRYDDDDDFEYSSVGDVDYLPLELDLHNLHLNEEMHCTEQGLSLDHDDLTNSKIFQNSTESPGVHPSKDVFSGGRHQQIIDEQRTVMAGIVKDWGFKEEKTALQFLRALENTQGRAATLKLPKTDSQTRLKAFLARSEKYKGISSRLASTDITCSKCNIRNHPL